MDFKINDKIIYPSHGLGVIIDITHEVVLGNEISMYVIRFEREDMLLKLPVANAKKVGLRYLSDKSIITRIAKTLLSKAMVMERHLE